MPELPEIEAIARTLRPLVLGRKIVCCQVIHSIATRPLAKGTQRAADALRAESEGQTIRSVERRGKYLLVGLEHGWLVFHFRLDGKLLWFDAGEAHGHVDVVFHFAHGTLGFVDQRHLGRVQWVARQDELRGIAELGLEPLSEGFTPERLETLLGKSRQPLKLWLMNQKRIAGLGNIYASEALWRAQLGPRRRACQVKPKEAQRLQQGIVAVLRAALECCLGAAPDFRNPAWWFAGLEKLLRVYERAGEPCRRCSRPIRHVVLGGRASYYCPGCQR